MHKTVLLLLCNGEDHMISYDRLWKTMKDRGMTQYKLIKDHKISSGQLDRLRKNLNVNMFTIAALCDILDCGLDDVVEYKKD